MFRLFGYFICAFPFLVASLSCDSTEQPPTVPPPPDLRKITLSVEDVSCTEVWLNIKADSLTFPSEIILLKDTVTQTISLCCSDTTLYIDSLLPNKPYTCKAILTADTSIKSEIVTAQTLDTTSHNFTWQSWTFGEHSSSVLYDVAIIDENNIWAVGEIYMNDSLGNPDPKYYNAAHWNGTVWELKRILYDENIWSIKTIYAFNENDIWFAAFVHYYNGEFIELPIPDILMGWSINKIWGTSSNDLYVVGNGGNIAHYSGPSGGWQKIESGTDLDLIDIYGDDEGNIYAAGLDVSLVKGVVLKSNQSGLWCVMIVGEIIDDTELFEKLFGRLGTLWVDELGTLYAGADFLYYYKNKEWDYVRSLPENYIGSDPYYIGYLYSIRGNRSNDILICGDRNTLRHFNGVNWFEIGIPYNPYRSIFWRSVGIKDNLAVAVGDEGIKAEIIILKR